MKVRAARFFIACAIHRCPMCNASSPVTSIVLPPGHETQDFDEPDEIDEQAAGWARSEQHALLFFVEHVSPGALARLRQETRHYRTASPADESDDFLRNHCERCGAAFDDQDLVCEPGGPFLPTHALEAARIVLIQIDEPIEASTAGYAYEPEFFSAVSRA